MRQILITNDDGIDADGLRRLAEAAKEFGEVWVVAPDGQRSAASHSITLHAPIDVYPVRYPVEGVHAYKCTGTPGDCVRTGSLGIMSKRPDVVLSGINKGYNVASDIQYSATAGAAFEGAFQGYLSIALSEGFGECHEVTDAYLTEILTMLLDRPFAAGTIWNVNFPDCALEECRGVLRDRTVSKGMFYKDTYDVIAKLPDDGVRLMVHGTYSEDAEEGTDFRAIVDRFVSIGQVKNIGYNNGALLYYRK
ncbi:MAG: 5'/3'-nucleotidase SurE [Lachnospiraceae bacterium]|nr:5'/3'-nucleotidase SurE [Lachnospiraceae bacterium]